MLSESARCLAEDELPSGGGVLTPATAMNGALVRRLRQSGFTFEVRRVDGLTPGASCPPGGDLEPWREFVSASSEADH